MKKINIIDSFALFFRLYYAMMGLKTSSGKSSGMVSGFATFVANLERDFPADYIIFALEGGGATFRHEIYPAYKANRSEAPAELKEQIPVCKEMIERMGFCSISRAGFEADDVIASLVAKYGAEYEINILSGDKDLFALISDNVKIIDAKNKITYDRVGCYEKYGVYPEQIRDYLSITGDSSDNVPGIKGLGERGARAILEQFGSLENAFLNAESIANTRARNLLIAGKDAAALSSKLIALRYDVPDLPSLDQCVLPQNPLAKITDILEEYSLNRILSKLENKGLKAEFQNSLEFQKSVEFQNNLEFQSKLILDSKSLENILSKLSANSVVAFDTETTGLEVKTAKIIGFSFAIKGENIAYYVPLKHDYLGVGEQISLEAAKKAIEKIYTAQVVGHNLKYDFEIISNNFGLALPTNYADTMILAWLSDPEQSCSMDNLAKKLFNHSTIKFEELVKKGQNFGSVELETACKYASEDAFVTMKFFEFYEKNLEPHLWDIARKVEFPFIATLIELERAGINASKERLESLNESLGKKLLALENEIYELAGERFNINSPKQLGVVLFEHLGLPSGKKTKSGYSTDESVLKSLDHPICAPLLAYREFAKLKGTYTEPFIKLCGADPFADFFGSKSSARIYTHFMHTGTATGRLSSHSPNLQNIPSRGSKDMRNCFVAPAGRVLLSLDYSQIELRLLAHFSGDPALISAFKAGQDIHASTAISIFGDSKPEHRAVAKSINFGLIYGMGSSRLASNLGIAKSLAKEYIERYFASFATIKSYLESIKSFANENGFVSTILGRRRVFNFAGANPRDKALFEREAVNSVFQGSAADIIKLAMNEIKPLLNDDIKMILQIHDELIFELKAELATEFAKKAASIMENVLELKVPLKVNYSINESWGELK